MNKNAKIFIKFFTVITLFFLSLLPTAINAQETFTRRNAVVIAAEKVGPAVANLSTERLLVESVLAPFMVLEMISLINFSMSFVSSEQSGDH